MKVTPPDQLSKAELVALVKLLCAPGATLLSSNAAYPSLGRKGWAYFVGSNGGYTLNGDIDLQQAAGLRRHEEVEPKRSKKKRTLRSASGPLAHIQHILDKIELELPGDAEDMPDTAAEDVFEWLKQNRVSFHRARREDVWEALNALYGMTRG